MASIYLSPAHKSNLVWVDNVRSLIRLCNDHGYISKDRGSDYNYLMGSTLKAQLAAEIKTEHRRIWNSSMCGLSHGLTC